MAEGSEQRVGKRRKGMGCLGWGLVLVVAVVALPVLWWKAAEYERLRTKPKDFVVGARVEVTVDGAPVVFEEYITCRFVKVFSGGISDRDAYSYLPWPQAIGKRLTPELAVAATVPWDICKRMGQDMPWLAAVYERRPGDRPEPAMPENWLPVLALIEGSWPPHTVEIPLTWEAAHDPVNRVNFRRMTLLPPPPEGSQVQPQMEFQAIADGAAQRNRRGKVPPELLERYYGAIALQAEPPWAEWLTEFVPADGQPFAVPADELPRLTSHFPDIQLVSEILFGPHVYGSFDIDNYIARGGMVRRRKGWSFEPLLSFPLAVLPTRLNGGALEIADGRDVLRLYRGDQLPGPPKPAFQPDIRVDGHVLTDLNHSPAIAVPRERQIYWAITTDRFFVFPPDAERKEP